MDDPVGCCPSSSMYVCTCVCVYLTYQAFSLPTAIQGCLLLAWLLRRNGGMGMRSEQMNRERHARIFCLPYLPAGAFLTPAPTPTRPRPRTAASLPACMSFPSVPAPVRSPISRDTGTSQRVWVSGWVDGWMGNAEKRRSLERQHKAGKRQRAVDGSG